MVALRRRSDPAGSMRTTPGTSRRRAISPPIISSASCSRTRVTFCSSRAMPARMFCSVRSERPLMPRSCPSAAAARSASTESMPRSSCRSLTVRGPTPGIFRISSRPSGTCACSLSWYARLPVSRQLRQLLGERRAGAGQLGRRAAPVQRRNVLRIALDGIGHPAIGDRLVDHLAHDLEHVADLAEDTRQLEVGQQGIVGTRHRARSGHRRNSRSTKRPDPVAGSGRGGAVVCGLDRLALGSAQRPADAGGERLAAAPTDHVRRALASPRLTQQFLLLERGQQAEVRSASTHLMSFLNVASSRDVTDYMPSRGYMKSVPGTK